ncbi:MAG TPA: thioredoxin domain-containing protein [Candidatus Limnocylindria bacterium]|nr:thioredoxin domain-containing protein [Candidatus Limnocylindria bacterium]
MLIVLGGSGSRPPDVPSVATSPPGASLKIRGDVAAPVEVEEWSDFQCPFCRQLALDVEPKVLASRVQTGRAKVVWRHFAFLGQESSWAAEASECANDQGKFWEYHDKLFAEQAGENRGTFRKDALKRFASDLGLDRAAFDACLDGGRHTARVAADTAAGRQKGVTVTPTLFVNGRKSEGVPTVAQLEAAIDAAR